MEEAKTTGNATQAKKADASFGAPPCPNAVACAKYFSARHSTGYRCSDQKRLAFRPIHPENVPAQFGVSAAPAIVVARANAFASKALFTVAVDALGSRQSTADLSPGASWLRCAAAAATT